jgi:hypothetical protein
LPETQVYDNFTLEWTLEDDNPPVDMEEIKKEAEEKQKALEEELKKEAEERQKALEEERRREEERYAEEQRKIAESLEVSSETGSDDNMTESEPDLTEGIDIGLDAYEDTDISEEKLQGNISETLPDIATELSPRKDEAENPAEKKEVDFTGMQSEYGAKKILDHIAQISNETHTITNVRGVWNTNVSVPKNAVEKSVAMATKNAAALSKPVTFETKETPAEPEAPKEPTTMEVIANGNLIRMTGKPVYMYVDIFDFIDFDLKTPHGSSVVTEINGRKASFTESLHNGDVISIYWKE